MGVRLSTTRKMDEGSVLLAAITAANTGKNGSKSRAWKEVVRSRFRGARRKHHRKNSAKKVSFRLETSACYGETLLQSKRSSSGGSSQEDSASALETSTASSVSHRTASVSQDTSYKTAQLLDGLCEEGDPDPRPVHGSKNSKDSFRDRCVVVNHVVSERIVDACLEECVAQSECVDSDERRDTMELLQQEALAELFVDNEFRSRCRRHPMAARASLISC